MKGLFCFFALFCCAALPGQPAGPPVFPEFLWTGSWEEGGNLTDRFEFKLNAPRPQLKLRLQLLDRRPAPFREEFAESFSGGNKVLTEPGVGLYHSPTGSRALYGLLDTGGLAARIRNIWIRGAPYAEVHGPSSGDLRTAPASTAVPQGYAYLGTPYLELGPGGLRGFASFALSADEEMVPALGAGTDYRFGAAGLFRLEGYYTERTLPERLSSTWFSEKPALPRRDTRLFAGSLAFNLPVFGLAADLAYSETFAFGADYYGNLGLRLGDKPWRLSLALDAAGSRYVDGEGGVPGAGLRGAARLERRGRRSSLLRISALFRGPGPEQGFAEALQNGDFASMADSFNRTDLALYYRLPASSSVLGLTRFSLSLDRDGRDAEKVLDSAGALAALKLGPVNTVTEAKITGVDQEGYDLESYKISQLLSWKFQIPGSIPGRRDKNTGPAGLPPVYCSAKAGYGKTEGKDGLWDISLAVSVRGKRNRLSFKAASPDLPEKWEYTISWRMEL